MEDQAYAINRLAAAIARRVADAAGREVVVAGSIGPTGELFEPLGALTMAAAEDGFAEQARGLKDGGADVAWIETMSAEEELEAAARAAVAAGLPYVITASFDTAGRTMMGMTPQALAALAARLPVPPLAFGANCGIGPGDLVASVLAMSEAAPGATIVAKGNCGIPVLIGEHYVTGVADEILTTMLGSCISACIRYPAAAVGGKVGQWSLAFLAALAAHRRQYQ
jgi:5-methyltetrahydrofolate--homocysteine methyltransferase